MANFFLALERGLVVVPAINKIDLPNAKPEEAIAQIESLFGIAKDQVRIGLLSLCDYPFYAISNRLSTPANV